MTYTKSSELPKEDGYYWVKYKWKSSSYDIELESVILLNSETGEQWISIFHSEEVELFVSEYFSESYESLAYCKIEKPKDPI